MNKLSFHWWISRSIKSQSVSEWLFFDSFDANASYNLFFVPSNGATIFAYVPLSKVKQMYKIKQLIRYRWFFRCSQHSFFSYFQSNWTAFCYFLTERKKKQSKLATRFANRNISCVTRQVDRTLTQITNICSILQSKIAIEYLRNLWANASVSSCHSFRFNVANCRYSFSMGLRDTQITYTHKRTLIPIHKCICVGSPY